MWRVTDRPSVGPLGCTLLRVSSYLSLSVCLSLFLYLSVYLSAFIYLPLSICFYLSFCICLFIYLSLSVWVYLSVFIYLSLFVCLYLSFFICLSLSVCLYLSVFICLSVCLYRSRPKFGFSRLSCALQFVPSLDHFLHQLYSSTCSLSLLWPDSRNPALAPKPTRRLDSGLSNLTQPLCLKLFLRCGFSYLQDISEIYIHITCVYIYITVIVLKHLYSAT